MKGELVPMGPLPIYCKVKWGWVIDIGLMQDGLQDLVSFRGNKIFTVWQIPVALYEPSTGWWVYKWLACSDHIQGQLERWNVRSGGGLRVVPLDYLVGQVLHGSPQGRHRIALSP